jgi:thioredoxin
VEIVKIGAMWCSGCLIMNKIFKEITNERDINITSLDIDIDEEEALKYEPGDILPVFIFFVDEREVHRMVGEHSKEEILNVIDGIDS